MKKNSKKSPASQRTINAWKTKKANKIKEAEDLLSLKSENLRLNHALYLLENNKEPVTPKSLKEDFEALLKQESELTMKIIEKRNEITAFTKEAKENLKLIESYSL